MQEKIIDCCIRADLKGLTELLDQQEKIAHLNLNFFDPQSGMSPLIAACSEKLFSDNEPFPPETEFKERRKRRIEIIKLLVAKGADPNFQNKDGNAPIFEAIKASPDFLETLLQLKANPNLKYLEDTPLYSALTKNYITVRLLLKYGADPNIPDRNGITPFQWSLLGSRVSKGVADVFLTQPQFLEDLKSESKLKKIIDKLTEVVSSGNKDEYSEAQKTKLINTLNKLLVRAISINDPAFYPLITYILQNHKGLKINQLFGGTTFLSIALKSGQLSVVEALKAKGAIDYEAYSGTDKEAIEVRDFMSRYQSVVEAGHLHGLGSGYSGMFANKLEIAPLQGDEKVDVQLEGNLAENTVPFLVTLLDRHIDKQNIDQKVKQDFNFIRHAFQNEVDYLKGDHTKKLNEKIENYKRGGLEIISSGWPGHAITIALYKGHLILCNRGQKASHYDFVQNVSIFKLKEADKLDEDILKILSNRHHYTPNEVMAAIGTLVDLKNPIAEFPSKNQKHGTCSFVNAKSIIEPILYILNTETKTKSEKHDSIALDLNNIDPKAKEASKKYAREQYKLFTQKMRDMDIMDRYLNALETKSILKKDTEFNILKEIVIRHHGQSQNAPLFSSIRRDKRIQEIDRMLDILKHLPSETVKELMESKRDIFKSDNPFKFILANALELGHMDMVNFLLDKKIAYHTFLKNILINADVFDDPNKIKGVLAAPLIRFLQKRGNTIESIAKDCGLDAIIIQTLLIDYPEKMDTKPLLMQFEIKRTEENHLSPKGPSPKI